MCDEVISVGCDELPNGTRFRATHRDSRLTLELSVPCDLLRVLIGGCGADPDEEPP